MPKSSVLPDFLIITTNSSTHARYWQRRLNGAYALGIGPDCKICCIFEEWDGGAGNGLGTLFALQKASEKMVLYGADLMKELDEGASVVILHTAGSGTRLAPLTLAEHNNKSAVALPAYYQMQNEMRLLTILEAVIKQIFIDGVPAGRVSVFWGDQLFLAQEGPPLSRSTAHIAVAARRCPIPDIALWNKGHYHRYGMITKSYGGTFSHLDKVSFEQLSAWLDNHGSQIDCLAQSLGSFSLSGAMTRALLEEFSEELRQRRAKMDVEPAIWMATTLDKDTYLTYMQGRGWSMRAASDHFMRMETFKKRLCEEDASVAYYAADDVGEGVFWWDFGTLSAYYYNLIEMVHNSARGIALRNFLLRNDAETIEAASYREHNSLVLNSTIAAGKVVNSILVEVHADEIEVDNVIAIRTSASSLCAYHALAYHIIDSQPLTLAPDGVAVDVPCPGRKGAYRLLTDLHRDGKADWAEPLHNNPCSYAALHEEIKKADLSMR